MTFGDRLKASSSLISGTVAELLSNPITASASSGSCDLGIDNITIPTVSIDTTSIEKAAAGVSKSIRDLNLKIC